MTAPSLCVSTQPARSNQDYQPNAEKRYITLQRRCKIVGNQWHHVVIERIGHDVTMLAQLR